MKKINYFLSIAVLAFLFTSVGCDSGDDGVPAVDQVGNTFQGTWSATSVFFGSPAQDRTTDYSGFTLTATYTVGQNGGTMSISGGPTGLRPFASTDNWSFVGEITDPNTSQFNITRTSDNLGITVSNFSTTGMTLTFQLADGGSTSRTEAVVGTWTFVMLKNP